METRKTLTIYSLIPTFLHAALFEVIRRWSGHEEVFFPSFSHVFSMLLFNLIWYCFQWDGCLGRDSVVSQIAKMIRETASGKIILEDCTLPPFQNAPQFPPRLFFSGIVLCFSVIFSERLYMEMADAMVYGGFREAGYQYVCIDVRSSLQFDIRKFSQLRRLQQTKRLLNWINISAMVTFLRLLFLASIPYCQQTALKMDI